MPFASLAGDTQVAVNYAAELVSRGHQVTVVSQPGLPAWTRLRMRLRRFGKDTHPKPSPLLDVPGLHHIILDRQRPVTDADAVIAIWWETAEWVAGLAPSKGRKFHFLQGYEMFPHQPLDRVAASFHLPLRKFAVSGYIRDMVLQNHGVDGIPVLPNPIDLTLFDAPPRARNPRLRVGFLYNTATYKNPDLALGVITAAQARCPDLEIMAFGEMPVDKRYPLPKGAQYRQRPPQAQIAGIYAACDLWLFTSRNEGSGLPLLEAMACRTPVLATRARPDRRVQRCSAGPRPRGLCRRDRPFPSHGRHRLARIFGCGMGNGPPSSHRTCDGHAAGHPERGRMDMWQGQNP